MQQPPALSKHVLAPRRPRSFTTVVLPAFICACLALVSVYELMLCMQRTLETYADAMADYFDGPYTQPPFPARPAASPLSATWSLTHWCEQDLLGRTFDAKAVYGEDMIVLGEVVAVSVDLPDESESRNGRLAEDACGVTDRYRAVVALYFDDMAYLQLEAPARVRSGYCRDGTIVRMHRELLYARLAPACGACWHPERIDPISACPILK